MLSQNKTKVNYISRLLVLPLTVIVFAAFTIKSKTFTTASLLENKTITVVIDAGHGGTDHGAVAADGTMEKNLALSLAKKIQEINRSGNIRILLIRDNDILQNVREKAETANRFGAELFVSIHVDGAPIPEANKQSGLSTWVSRDEFKNSTPSRAFASAITAAFTKNYPLRVASNPQQRGTGITVLQETNCPAVLIEAGFITNEKDLAYLKSPDGQEQFARNLLNAISNFAVNKEKNISIAAPGYNFSPSKQPSPKDNKIVRLTNPTLITGIEGIIRIDADTFEINKKNDSAAGNNALIIMDGKEYKPGDLYNKKIVAMQGLLYPKNDPAMLKKYGDKASSGVFILENASITDLSNHNKKPFIKDDHLTFNTDSSYAVDASQSINLSRENYSNTKKAAIFTNPDKTHPLLFVDGKPKDLSFMDKISTDIIQQVQILKGKEATNKYSGKAKNGVIEITLKKVPVVTTPEPETNANNHKIFTKVEQEPDFPGGKDGWQAYLQKHINPATPVGEGWKPGTYTIVVQFIVDKSGTVSDIKTDDFPASKTARQCIDLIKSGPKWIPAKQNGKIVIAYRKQPITFVVSEN